MDQLLNKNREGEKSRDLIKDKIEPNAKDSFIENSSNCTSGSSKPSSPSIPLQSSVTRSTRGDLRSHPKGFRLPVQDVNKRKKIKRRRKMQLSE